MPLLNTLFIAVVVLGAFFLFIQLGLIVSRYLARLIDGKPAPEQAQLSVKDIVLNVFGSRTAVNETFFQGRKSLSPASSVLFYGIVAGICIYQIWGVDRLHFLSFDIMQADVMQSMVTSDRTHSVVIALLFQTPIISMLLLLYCLFRVNVGLKKLTESQ